MYETREREYTSHISGVWARRPIRWGNTCFKYANERIWIPFPFLFCLVCFDGFDEHKFETKKNQRAKPLKTQGCHFGFMCANVYRTRLRSSYCRWWIVFSLRFCRRFVYKLVKDAMRWDRATKWMVWPSCDDFSRYRQRHVSGVISYTFDHNGVYW